MNVDESMLEVYIYETQQLLESLEDTLLKGENEKRLDSDDINEVFRVMHTIKGASAMMEFENVTKLAHSLEDMFSFIRESGAPQNQWPNIFDLVFAAVAFFNNEVAKLQANSPMDGDASDIFEKITVQLARLKGAPEEIAPAAQKSVNVVNSAENGEGTGNATVKSDAPCYKIKLSFEDNSLMENLRAFGVVQSLKGISLSTCTVPSDLNDDSASQEIVRNGFLLFLQTNENPDRIKEIIDGTLFLKSCSVLPIEIDDEEIPESIRRKKETGHEESAHAKASSGQTAENSIVETVSKQNFISVNVNKLDSLLNIVGEIVTAQSMVINNADFGDSQHDSFDAAAQQLHSLINELQDVVMNIRMIPVSTLFQKMRRLVRDMAKKFDKDIELELIGEETEVDKNVIDCLSDPLLHIVRNSVDHGVEDRETRKKAGKSPRGKITLEARTTGSDVIVTITDDGKGLQRENILKKAHEKGLLTKPEEEMTDKEVFLLIFLPGFSTKEEVTEFSGRGVGMDVVRKNISLIGGSITLESEPGKGTTHIIRIPLTLSIIDGMKFGVGAMNFIVPTVSVRCALKPDLSAIFKDPDGNEMVLLQEKCYPLLRLNQFFNVENGITELSEGMIMLITSEEKDFCIFFDHLDGEYQVVVKSLPSYLKNCSSSLDGVGGCAILGDGSINLIVDVNSL